jgi:dTDP-4-dehydrorhamnose reductase
LRQIGPSEVIQMTRRRRVTITGGTGQLGAALCALLAPSCEIDSLASADVDLRDWRAMRDRIARFGPDLVLNCAAATDVDRCEREPDWAYALNALGARHVAQAAALVGAELVQVSTNYVFDGGQPTAYHEGDTPNPISVYGASKLAGEVEARAATSRCFVVRTAWLYAPQGRNFMLTMRRLMAERPGLRVVNDQFGNPTLAHDLARGILAIVAGAPYGVYHVVNQGVASWYDWAVEIARQTGARVAIEPIPALEYPRAATPPANGTLASLSLPGLGITLPHWRDALRRCLTA